MKSKAGKMLLLRGLRLIKIMRNFWNIAKVNVKNEKK